MPDTHSFHLTIEDELAWLAIDVPGESMNTLKATFVDEIEAIIATLSQSSQSLKGLVIYSRKPDNFIAGADIHMIEQCSSAEDAAHLAKMGQDIFRKIEALPFPVVAAIHGACLGGGLELALACDYRVCSDDPGTSLGLPEVQLGLLPGSGGTQRLPRIIGLLPALDLILTGKKVRSHKARKLGLVNACVAKDGLLNAARMVVEKPAEFKIRSGWKKRLTSWVLSLKPIRQWVINQARKKAQSKARNHYPAIDMILDVIQQGLEKGLEAGLKQESQAFGTLAMTPESRALRSIFLGTTALKREMKTDETVKDIRHVSVLGGGLMGAGIGYVTVDKARKPLRIKDVSHQGVLHAFQYIYQRLNKKCQRKYMTESDVRSAMASVSGGIDFSGFDQTDLVVEAVFEDLKLKQEMVASVEAHTKESTIFASNTSSLPIHEIAANAARPENIVGLHYFSPVEKMPLVEVIPHQGTAPETVATVVRLAYQQGKTPIIVQDSAGFYVNRILAPYINGAVQCLLDGEPIEKIDQALIDFGFPVGPMTLLDEVGFDVAFKISPILVRELGERFQTPPALEQLISDGRKGRKSGLGFYRYKGKEKRPDQSIYRQLKIRENAQLSHQDIALRCILPLLNEAAMCLEQSVIRNARDGDIGAIFGIGFPPFLGGPFRYMDQMGLQQIVDQMQALSGDLCQPCPALLARLENNQTFYSD
ncbi:fatty acid oxidation complex subunit alpha FadJ [Vibrio mangrovi]|uniref:enoyl-CoA hydratase n=1 Tax=Vibrio mangrovi TaxID=474394 RepID=A0A1Y6IRP1_9VIBR|nr:fatty acid oxidation complex subunit alpha FadJ [Vibrio mangrovi]MDW6003497.1 fatty acid oxidation complex subunit alpha FadJ [Vibrio mangrovi]SMR99711.1 Fatty acid oxidation complex subunit alpha [Vibrio mangrovi]